MSNIINEVKSAPDTFTSWDKCMSKAYCKWPVIAGIVIGSLILLSVLFCLVQCLCCGYSCAKMLCCCCNGCDCGGKGRRRSKDDRGPQHKDSNYHQLHTPNPYSGYQPPAAMAPTYGGPQTATFESDTKGGDALPAMPSWDNAISHRVEVNDPAPRHNQDVEMGRLNPQNTRHGYDQVPLSPMSPSRAMPGYFPPQTNQPYASDISDERLPQQVTGYSHSNFEPTSPAPTYQTHAQQPSGDRFMPGTASPSPYGYHSQPANNNYYDSTPAPYYDSAPSAYAAGAMAPRSNSFSPPPAGTMPTSNSYNSFHNSGSPAPYESSSPYQSHQRQSSYTDRGAGGARPPPLLQVGRKAVPGSMREV